MKKLQKEGEDEVKSPCVRRCSLDQNKICPGCYRSIEEIALWSDADNIIRQEILEAVNLRRSGSKNEASEGSIVRPKKRNGR